MIRQQIKPAILVFIILSLITGIIYPLCVTGVARVLFRDKASGSLIYSNGKSIGSALIGQSFDDPKYFWGRLSATLPVSFNAASSSGSNVGPMNSVLIKTVKKRIIALKSSDPGNSNPIPVDLVTSSASGLDPHISLSAAYYQVPRIARIRGLFQEQVKAIINAHISGRFLGVLGEPVVNVLELNLALDVYKK